LGRKTYNKDKEFDLLQKLKAENKKLKRENSRLKKELSKIDLDRYNNLKELVEVQRKEDKIIHEEEKKQILKERWECFKCGEDALRLMIFNRLDGVFYYRRCPTCGHRTKMKKYKEGIEGFRE
jgi:rubrerythrin